MAQLILGSLGLQGDDFKELADFAKFPFTDKETLRSEYPFGMFAVNQLADSFAVYPSLSGTITEAARRLVAHDDLE